MGCPNNQPYTRTERVISVEREHTMTEELKRKLFERVLWLEHMAEETTYDHHDYSSESDGAYSMLEVLGLGREYINWAIGK